MLTILYQIWAFFASAPKEATTCPSPRPLALRSFLVFTLCTFWFLPFWAFACEALVFTLPEGRVKNQSFAGKGPAELWVFTKNQKVKTQSSAGPLPSFSRFFQSGRKRSFGFYPFGPLPSFSRFFQSGRKRSFGFYPFGPLPAKLWFLPFG